MPRLDPTSSCPPQHSIRAGYEAHGSNAYYQRFGTDYRNPHEPAVRRSLHEAARAWPLDLSHVLDLAAGSGEATLVFRKLGAGRIDAIDPYTAEAYANRTGSPAEQFTFAQIAAGALAGRRYSLIVCSFALHLCEPSRLPTLLYQLAQVSHNLLILTPHKRPQIPEEWGWTLIQEQVIERVRTRLYRTGEIEVGKAG